MNGARLRTSGRLTAACVGVVLMTTCYHPPHRRTPDWDIEPGEDRPDRLTAQQERAATIPLAPSEFSPDSGAEYRAAVPRLPEIHIGRERIITEEAPLPPSVFNPDPGQGWEAAPQKKPDGNAGAARRDNPFFNESGLGKRPFFGDDAGSDDGGFFGRDAGAPLFGKRFTPVIPDGMVLPRKDVELNRLEFDIVDAGIPEPYQPDISKPFELPRGDVRFEERIYEHWHAGHHDHAEDPANTASVEDRWNIATGKWQRYLDDKLAETPYERDTPYLWHPYYQSRLKGDVPVFPDRWQDVFASITLQNFTDIEARTIPTPAGVSTARGGNAEFYGRSEQSGIVTNTSLTLDIFRGETSFKPVEWMFRIQPVFNTNYVSVSETTLVSPDPRGLGQSTGSPPGNPFGTNPGGINPGDIDLYLDPLLFPAGGDFRRSDATERFENHFALQQFFFEAHLLDLSENYDFAALRVGTQTFNADFRGHVFFDSNWGYRLFGNYAKNRIQYNLAFFDLFEKESFSELNTWDDRNQNVFVANLYLQDFLVEGYTTQLNFLANWDKGTDSGLVYDSAGNVVRPTPVGTIAPHDLEAYYLGWNGEGHFGRLNISHSLYHVFGEDDLNGLAGGSVDIEAWMAALELSVDTDWMRHKLTLFWASGDDDATDGTAKGWDSIVDSPNLIGGPFSYWQRQGPNLGGTAVALKQRLSLIPNLRSNKFLGQSSFVNPGIFIAGIGEEWELTPKTRFFANLNYMMFMETDPISAALLTDGIDREIGWDLSFGIEHRPFLTENLRIVAGIGLLFPGKGLKDIYRTTQPTVGGFSSGGGSGDIDGVLYSGFLGATMTF